jgi:hypothetical protein
MRATETHSDLLVALALSILLLAPCVPPALSFFSSLPAVMPGRERSASAASELSEARVHNAGRFESGGGNEEEEEKEDADGFPPRGEDYSEDYPDDWEEDQSSVPADYEFVVLTAKPSEQPSRPVFVVQLRELGGTNDRTCFLPFLPRGPTGWLDGLEGHAYVYEPRGVAFDSVEKMRAAAAECRSALLALGLTENPAMHAAVSDSHEPFSG